jgi:hypothetical protein
LCCSENDDRVGGTSPGLTPWPVSRGPVWGGVVVGLALADPVELLEGTAEGVGLTVDRFSAEPPQAVRAAAHVASAISPNSPRTGHVYQKRHHDRIYGPGTCGCCHAVS